VIHPLTPSVGASAGLFGLIGAMIALGVKHRNAMGAAIRGVYVRWAIYGLIFSLMGGIDMAAHIGGLAGGFGLAYVAGLPTGAGSVTERIWRVSSWAGVLVTALSFVLMYAAFSGAAG
jgi:rhomboid protease GluP